MKIRSRLLLSIVLPCLVLLLFSIENISQIIKNGINRKYDLSTQIIETIELYEFRDLSNQNIISRKISFSDDEIDEFKKVIEDFRSDIMYQRQGRRIYIYLKIVTTDREYIVALSKGDINLFIDIRCEDYREYFVLNDDAIFYFNELCNKILM